jgi:hypothetical protein
LYTQVIMSTSQALMPGHPSGIVQGPPTPTPHPPID